MAMDLSTSYMGLKLPHPFVPGASPLMHDLDTVRRLEDAGAAAVVLHSLFEEQITREQIATFLHSQAHGESFAEALSYFPPPDQFPLGPEEYLEHVGRVKQTVDVPVIASLNGTTKGGWVEYAKVMEQAGADGLELNLYMLALDPTVSSQEVEDGEIELVREVKKSLRIPVAVKVSPFYTSFAHMATRLVDAGADALVVFNRFYQPDIDPEGLQVARTLHLSDSSELPLRLRWLAFLSGRVKASLAVTGGVHTSVDAVKATMAGAHAIQMVSVLLRKGPEYLRTLRAGFEDWLVEHEYESLAQMQGSMGLLSCPDPHAYERANYMLMLQSWRE
jgi:dihydroorotate dehydrogenase (fumarate)